MKIKPASPEAYWLFHEGVKTLAQVEQNGIRVDTKYLDETMDATQKRLRKLEGEIRESTLGKSWRRIWGHKMKLNAPNQIGKVLIKAGHKFREKTKTKKAKVDKSALAEIAQNEPDVARYIEWKELYKARNTFLVGIQRETCNGRLHPFFNLSGSVSSDDKGDPATYRGASDSPNFQNYPVRDKLVSKLIRSCFIPSKGCTLIEIDFSGIEVRIAYCYHKDPVMKKYLLDKDKDMHRDMAAQCYKLEPEQIDKTVRYCGKNMFVFPQFYGDDYMKCSKNLWEACVKMDLKAGEIPLRQHLKSKGISKLGKQSRNDEPCKGTFEYHIKQVQEDFWGKRFKVYGQWRRDWYDLYRQRCWFDMKTGFVCHGVFKKNQVINYPVQGAAFHCLLWVLIELQKWLNKKGMKTKIVGQIHDSILLDAPENEKIEVLYKCYDLMTRALQKAWPWIIIPLEVEIDTTTTNWYEKQPFTLAV